MKKLLILTFPLFMAACGNPNEPNAEAQKTETITPTTPSLTEDQILLQLSPYLIADPQEQGEREQNAIIDYAIKELIPLEATRSGLFYRIIDPGEGEPLQWGDYIKVHYKGYFLDGWIFDDTRRREKPMEFYIGNMISGWNEGLQLIATGGSIQLFVPSALAYEEEGLPDGKGGLLVPPNKALVFEVEVLERLKRAGEE